MKRVAVVLFVLAVALAGCTSDEGDSQAKPRAKQHEVGRDAHSRRIERMVDDAIRPVMRENDVPGVAVGLTVNGKRYVYTYGVADKASGRRVSKRTIFEIGSVSKTFTATLGAYARERGALSLSDPASRHWPALAGTAFDRISLRDLGTYTPGGLPLQFPEDVTDEAQTIRYFRGWRPTYEPGTHRLYSNPSIGLFGHLAARSLGRPFDDLMQGRVFPKLGLNRTYIHVPKRRMGDYAFGYTEDGEPVRVTPGAFDSQAYGVKTTAPDLIRFVEQNMSATTADASLRRAIAGTHTGYHRVRGMTQGLGWEMYPHHASLDRLLEGNSPAVALEPNPVEALDPPRPPQRSALLNKTGSTNGFGAYVAFTPSKRTGVVILANKNYPIPVRVRTGYKLLTALSR